MGMRPWGRKMSINTTRTPYRKNRKSWMTRSFSVSTTSTKEATATPGMLSMAPKLDSRAPSHPGQVLPRAGVDAEHVPRVDEEGNLDHQARRHGGRLGGARGRVALEARLGVDHLQLHHGGRLDPAGFLLVEDHGDFHVLLQVVDRIAEAGDVEGDLV